MKEQEIQDIVAADKFRSTLIQRSDKDDHGAPLWYGWAIVEAYMAGLKAGREERMPKAMPAPK